MKVVRGTLIWFDSSKSYNLIEDGLIFIQQGKIHKVGNFSDFQLSQDEVKNLDDHSGKIIMPGFIDTHVHYPQFQVIGSYGTQLLQWLEKYTFPVERKFSNKQYAKKIANIFLQQLRKNGTTTCMTFATVFKDSVDAFFEEAQKLNMQVIAGKVMMDRNCPQFLQDTPETGYKDSLELIQKWHRKGRNHYAVTPRFAPTSSRQQLQACSKLMKSAQKLYLQTHANQDKNQVKWVQQLFPQHETYMDVYNHYQLVCERSIFAHCIHFEDEDFLMIKEKGAAISHCPDSNLFLGSGFYKIEDAKNLGVMTSIGSDIGGGTTVNLLKILAECYKMHKMNKYTLSPVEAFYLITLGGAKALHLDDHLGKIKEGYYADLVVLDPKGSEYLKAKDMITIQQKLFGLIMLGDDRVVTKTYIAGQ